MQSNDKIIISDGVEPPESITKTKGLTLLIIAQTKVGRFYPFTKKNRRMIIKI